MSVIDHAQVLKTNSKIVGVSSKVVYVFECCMENVPMKFILCLKKVTICF